MMTVLRSIGIVLALLVPIAVHADTGRAGSKQAYLYASVGDLKADETPGRLEGEGSSYGLVLGLGVPVRAHLALDGEIAAYSSKYNTPPLTAPFGGSVDTRMRVTSSGFAANARTFYEFSRGALYAGAGIGIFWSDLTVTGTIFGFPATRTETDMSLGHQLIAGGEVTISKEARLGVEYRKVYLKANFGELTSGSVDVGGRYVALTYRRAFGL